MILVDTTILVYAVGTEHPLKEPSRRLLAAHRRRRVRLGATIEVLQEFCHVYSRRRSRTEAVAKARAFAEALVLHPTDEADLKLGLKLFERLPGLGAFDAILAAVAINQRVEALVSADKGFNSVPGLAWMRPDSSQCAALLAARS